MTATPPIRVETEGSRQPTPFVESALLAEYGTLRDEIARLQEHQKEIMNFLFVAVGVMFAVAGTLLGSDAPRSVGPVFVLFPLFFTLLAALYADRTLRILVAADYIHNCLRPAMQRLAGARVMQWEDHKRNAGVFPRLRLVLDRVRWVTFLLASATAIILFFLVGHGDLGTVRDRLLIGGDLLAMAVAVGLMFATEETKGVESRDHPPDWLPAASHDGERA